MPLNNLPRQKLCEIIAKYGSSLCNDPRRCEAILRDSCGEHRREINLLVSALKERVPADLIASQGSVPHQVLLARLSNHLHNNLGLAEDFARWAVESWALALGVISSAELSQLRSESPRSGRVGTPTVIAQTQPSPQPNQVTERINPKDGAVMVYIPEGEFLMGTSDKQIDALLRQFPEWEGWELEIDNEKPQHHVYLDGYWIYKYEVTGAQYRKFCQETGRKMPHPPYWESWQDNHPIVNVTWKDAVAYCQWAGVQLPTEAQ